MSEALRRPETPLTLIPAGNAAFAATLRVSQSERLLAAPRHLAERLARRMTSESTI